VHLPGFGVEAALDTARCVRTKPAMGARCVDCGMEVVTKDLFAVLASEHVVTVGVK
jgi:hypothetical protein